MEKEIILDDNFQISVRKINNMRRNDKIIYEDFIKIYGHYKQALFGDNTQEKPCWFYFHKVKKWKSWKENMGKSKNDAKTDYIFGSNFIENKI